MLVNWHFHDEWSADAEGRLEEHCLEARRAGVADVCLTNHVELLDGSGAWRVEPGEAVERFGRIARSVEEARDHFPDLRIRLGAELEYRPEWREALDRLARAVPFDFLIGSLHDVDCHNVSGGGAERFFETRSRREAYGRYFELLAEMVEWGGFDVVGHFDLIKRYGHAAYGPYRPQEHEETIRGVLERMAEKGIGLEINTSGLFQGPRSCFPEPEILVWALEAGVEALTLGSDSHRPRDFARGLPEGAELARRTGWETLCVFEGREPRRVPLC